MRAYAFAKELAQRANTRLRPIKMCVRMKFHRLRHPITTVLLLVCLLAATYYLDQEVRSKTRKLNTTSNWFEAKESGQQIPSDACLPLNAATTDVETVKQFPTLEFQPSSMKIKHFWDSKFEERYTGKQFKPSAFPLKVILMPHSHNDPGWLKTYEGYFQQHTKNILDFMMTKMQMYTNMTFIWCEVSFLHLWYESTSPKSREQLKELVKSGRLEIVTGGWVMTDEANVHLYAMVNQLIEGHQWLSSNLKVKPTNGWSIDPFGHGPTVPYLLKESGISSTVIQRIHYAWKRWFAEKQSGDFMWRQNWDAAGEKEVLTHNCPFQMYSIRHSCGPYPEICINFDFRKIAGYHTDYTAKAEFITKKNVEEKANLLVEQYKRTSSLSPHNVLLVPIGDDFRYDYSIEWDQQYTNYQQLMNWINGNPSYHVDVQWGTLKDYFIEVKKRSKSFPSLKGDFFVYGDIFTDGKPGYWSGYFTTRPYWKSMGRQLEATLSGAEFLYTWAWGIFAKNNSTITQILKNDYKKLVIARRHLSLFQHHDAITGTSKKDVMSDYGIKLYTGIQEALTVISHSSLALMSTEATLSKFQDASTKLNYLQPNFQRSSYAELPKRIPIEMNRSQRLIVLTNSLAQRRYEMIKLIVTNLNLRLTDGHGHDIPFQINPIWKSTSNGMVIIPSQYELFFIADLPPLSIVTFTLHISPNVVPKSQLSTVYSNFYGTSNKEDKAKSAFETKDVLPGDILLESDSMKLLFDGTTGLIRSVTNKVTRRITQLAMRYAAYPSAKFKSGAYLFKPDPNAKEPEKNVLSGAKARIFIHSGSISSELTVMFGSVLMHSFRIFHVSYEPLASAIYMENSFNLDGTYNGSETPGFLPQFKETELFFRFATDINNGADSRFYTDQNGLGMQERTRVESIGIQGNYYPVTAATFLEDEVNEIKRRRVTLLVDRAAGVAAWKKGYLEAMVERRMSYDDARGMGEGVTDQKRTEGRYWVIIENLQGSEAIPQLSLGAHHLSNSLNFPPVLLVLDGLESNSLKAAAHFLTRPFPCSLHLLTMRTLADPQYPGMMPLNKALMVIQHQSPSCVAASSVASCRGLGGAFLPDTNFTFAVTDIHETELTGVTTKTRLAALADLVVPPHQLRSVIITSS